MSTAKPAEKFSQAQTAWLRFVDKVERGELQDPSGQYVAKGTKAADATGSRITRPKFNAGTAAFAEHYRLNKNGEVVAVPVLGEGGVASKEYVPCDCGDLPPAPTTTFISSQGLAPYSGADNPNGYIWDLKIGHGSAQGDHDGIPSSYTVLYSDLNKGAGGPFIYIGFTRVPSTASENPEAINAQPYAVGPVVGIGYVTKCCYTSDYTNILYPYFPIWKDTGVRLGFREYDLNEGVGGTYIHATLTKNPGFGVPIEIGVLSSNSANAQPPAGWAKASLDLNEGAGGDFIYFCIKSH